MTIELEPQGMDDEGPLLRPKSGLAKVTFEINETSVRPPLRGHHT